MAQVKQLAQGQRAKKRQRQDWNSGSVAPKILSHYAVLTPKDRVPCLLKLKAQDNRVCVCVCVK